MTKEKPLLGQGARKATTMRLPDELHARLKQKEEANEKQPEISALQCPYRHRDRA